MSQSLDSVLIEIADVLTTENDLLKRCDYRAVAELLPRKEAALGRLQTCAGEPGEPALALIRQVGGLAAENRRQLGTAVGVQRRVLEIIAGAARKAQPVGRYGAKGQRADGTQVPLALRVRA